MKTHSWVQDRRHDAHIIFTSTPSSKLLTFELVLETQELNRLHTRLLPSWRGVVTHTGDEVSYGRRAAPVARHSWLSAGSEVRRCDLAHSTQLRVRPPCFRSLSCNCWRAASPLHNAKVVPSDKSAPSARWLALSTLQFTSHEPDLTRYVAGVWTVDFVTSLQLCATFFVLLVAVLFHRLGVKNKTTISILFYSFQDPQAPSPHSFFRVDVFLA